MKQLMSFCCNETNDCDHPDKCRLGEMISDTIPDYCPFTGKPAN